MKSLETCGCHRRNKKRNYKEIKAEEKYELMNLLDILLNSFRMHATKSGQKFKK